MFLVKLTWHGPEALRGGVNTDREKEKSIEWSSVLDTDICQSDSYQVLLQSRSIEIFLTRLLFLFPFASFMTPA